jgi:quercetin dioxygenase-like cupin family protein
MTADRLEIVRRPDETRPIAIAPGVTLRPLVDAGAGARGLFVGLLSVEPGARYPHYSRPCTEALTLLEGEAALDAEDRRYPLGVLDNATVPGQLPRRVVNLSSAATATFHLVLSAANPSQAWVNARFATTEQPGASKGRDGGERITRNEPTARYEIGPRATFQDLFGAGLGSSGICGGLGLFEPGARLPCQRHESEGSVTILEGTATCIVEGRRHELADRATALIPQGLCHYLINLTLDPMALIWACAGDRPDRIVMDESRCHPERARPKPSRVK